jgi:uncharacterized protein (DUF2141 family)
MKTNINKCIWTAFIAVGALCMTTSAGAIGSPNNLGQAYISNVTSGSNCVFSNTNGGGIQFWDIQAGGTYTVTLTGVECDQGMDATIDVIVHNSTGGNINATATQQSVGVYTFTVTLGAQCLTMPIEYCTQISKTQEGAGWGPGTGLFAQDTIADGSAAGGHVGHLRTSTFDGSCVRTGDDTTCSGITCNPSSIQVTKFYDFSGNGTKDSGEQGLPNWPFCLTSPTDPDFVAQTGYTDTNGSVTFSNLGPGTYVVTEGTADGTWTGTTNTATITIDHCGQSGTATFGNYCTQPSGGLTLGFWSNKNGQKILTGSTTGATLYQPVVDRLNACSLRNADGSVHVFTSSYADLKNWLLKATATNMAYMLSAQLATLELDVNFGVPPNKVDGGAFDLCSLMTVNQLISDACNLLSNATCGATCNPASGSTTRVAMTVDKNCIDAINNNGPVIPVMPCAETFSTFTCP